MSPRERIATTIEPEVMRRAEYLMWLGELNAADENGRPDWEKRRRAAEIICETAGVRDVVRAIALDGELRPAPPWPKVDCVPVGGGPGIITCEVRTWIKGRGKLKVKIVLMRPPRKQKFDASQIEEATERGRFELRKIINGK